MGNVLINMGVYGAPSTPSGVGVGHKIRKEEKKGGRRKKGEKDTSINQKIGTGTDLILPSFRLSPKGSEGAWRTLEGLRWLKKSPKEPWRVSEGCRKHGHVNEMRDYFESINTALLADGQSNGRTHPLVIARSVQRRTEEYAEEKQMTF